MIPNTQRGAFGNSEINPLSQPWKVPVIHVDEDSFFAFEVSVVDAQLIGIF
jgi:hypothetical protein